MPLAAGVGPVGGGVDVEVDEPVAGEEAVADGASVVVVGRPSAGVEPAADSSDPPDPVETLEQPASPRQPAAQPARRNARRRIGPRKDRRT